VTGFWSSPPKSAIATRLSPLYGSAWAIPLGTNRYPVSAILPTLTVPHHLICVRVTLVETLVFPTCLLLPRWCSPRRSRSRRRWSRRRRRESRNLKSGLD
jgi:antibiotic biosynthesis monooxygenase (ABM) superfamily enzyme